MRSTGKTRQPVATEIKSDETAYSPLARAALATLAAQPVPPYLLAPEEVAMVINDDRGGSQYPAGCIVVATTAAPNDGRAHFTYQSMVGDKATTLIPGPKDGEHVLLVRVEEDGTETYSVRITETTIGDDGVEEIGCRYVRPDGTGPDGWKISTQAYNYGRVVAVVEATLPAPINADGNIFPPRQADPNPGNLLYTGPGYYELLSDPEHAAGICHIEPCAPWDTASDWFKITRASQPDGFAPTGYLERHIVRRIDSTN